MTHAALREQLKAASERAEAAEAALAKAREGALEAASIGLVIAGHFCSNPDDWLRAHEKTLRQIEADNRALRSRTTQA